MNEKQLSSIAMKATINLYSLGKETNRIELTGFNFNNKSHLAIVRFATFITTLYGHKFYIKTNLCSYFKIRKYLNKNKKLVKFLFKPRNSHVPSFNEFVSFIEGSEENGEGLFGLYYDLYYKEGENSNA